MKVTKYVHSCLLLEDGEKAAGVHRLLFDPGLFTFIEGNVRPEVFGDVGTVLITHAHPDHMDVEALKRLVAGGAEVFGNSDVVDKLGRSGVTATMFENGERQIGPFLVRALPAPHEPILADDVPLNSAFLVDNRFLNPGDSLHPHLQIDLELDLLALPVTAPWLTELQAIDMVRRLRPKHVLPIHDGYAKDFFRTSVYERYGRYIREAGGELHAAIEPGASVAF